MVIPLINLNIGVRFLLELLELGTCEIPGSLNQFPQKLQVLLLLHLSLHLTVYVNIRIPLMIVHLAAVEYFWRQLLYV